MTEWEYQEYLTRRWADEGIVVDGERLMLVAWEVMLDRAARRGTRRRSGRS